MFWLGHSFVPNLCQIFELEAMEHIKQSPVTTDDVLIAGFGGIFIFAQQFWQNKRTAPLKKNQRNLSHLREKV